ncbi:DUF1905 domain-containing protein [Blastomonas sp.]|uniref:DUF1905 domain-containing protein n=1 Tax=Blastomonas sp. TaxID=1909299 RepID=UPI00391D007D
MREEIARVEFSAPVIEWRGPAPFYFLALPQHCLGEIHHAARQASYGWGCVPVQANIGAVAFTTSLIPRDGGFLLPLKIAVRTAAGIDMADTVSATIRIFTPH